MSVTFGQLNSLILISDSVGSHLTAAVSTTYHVIGMYLHNTHSVAIEVTIYFVPNDGGAVGTPGAGNQIFKQTIDANQTYPINDITHYMNSANDSIQVVAGTASKVNIFIEGSAVDQ